MMKEMPINVVDSNQFMFVAHSDLLLLYFPLDTSFIHAR